MLADFAKSIKNAPEIRIHIQKLESNHELKRIKYEAQQKKRLGIFLAWAISLSITALLFTLIYLTNKSFPLSAFGLIPFGIVFALLWSYGLSQGANKRYQTYVTPGAVKLIYGEEAIYKAEGGFETSFLEELDEFKINNLEQEDWIDGCFEGVHCTMGDVSSYHYSSSKNGTNRVYDFRGTIMVFDLNKTASETLIVREGIHLFKGKGLKYGSEEFSQYFKTYCENEFNASYILTPEMQKGILDIRKTISGNLTLIFRGNKLILIRNGRTIDFHLDLKKDEAFNFNIIIDAIIPMAYVVKKLNLDIPYYSD